MLKVEKLKVGGLPPLSFEVARGECLAVEGPSGSGKTRLLRAIADLDEAPGYVSLDGAERRELPGPAWRKLVRYLSAEPGWWAAMAGDHFARGNEEANARLLRLMTSLGLEPALLDRPVSELSTGQRTRLALIRGLMDEPRVILLDEPTGALDREAAALVAELIRFQLLAERIVVLVSHNPAEIERLAHQRLLLGATGARDAMEATGRELQR